MGCRLHYAKKYEVEWQGGYFNWELDNVADIIRDAGGWVNYSDEGWDGEIDRDDLEKYINDVRHNDKEIPGINGYKTDAVLVILQDILENSDKNNNEIHLSFF